jgi:glycerophosphoryl diester phosphodiesterase
MKSIRSALALLLTLNIAACSGNDDGMSPPSGTPDAESPGNEDPSPGDPADPGSTDAGNPKDSGNPKDAGNTDAGNTDADAGDAAVEPVPEPQILLDESFDGLSALPAGWSVLSNSKGTASVHDGSLYIDGRADSYAMTTVSLPDSLKDLSNYRIDVEFTFEARNNESRWGSVMYRTSENAARTPYYQFAIRADAAASNGTELAQRTAANAWNVVSTKAHSEAIAAAKVYKATILVHGNRVRQYLDNTLLHDFTIDAALAKGGLGLSTAGLVMRVDRITVTEQLDPLPEMTKFVAVQESGTKVAMAPTIVQTMTSATSLDGTRASQGLFNLDSSLKLSTDAGTNVGTLRDYLTQANRVSIPVLRIKDEATVTALVQFAMTADVADITLLSDNVALLRKARIALPSVRVAVDFSNVGILGDTAQDVVQVVSATNRALAKIAVLPAAMSGRATVEHLQRLLITPWVVSSASTQAEAAEVLTTGVNGIIASQAKVFADVLAQLPANTLLRKPLVVGHRGLPSSTDENTLEGARLAVQAGADAVENDIYMTTDKQLVVMHDGTVDRTTTGTGAIENMTLAQVKQLRTDPGGFQVPTLEEYFAAFKTNKKVTHFIEIKSAKAEIVGLLKAAIDRHGVSDQAVAISFSGDQLNRMKSELPSLTGGFLTSVSAAGDDLLTARNILNQTQTYSSTFNPSYAGLTASMMEVAKHRGVTFWPWTFSNRADFIKYYSYGTHGLTTDDARWASDFVVRIASARTATAAVGQPLSVPMTLTTQVGNASSGVANKAVVLAGAPAHTINNADDSVTFSAAGTATILPGYTYVMDANYSYTIFAAPVTVTVK